MKIAHDGKYNGGGGQIFNTIVRDKIKEKFWSTNLMYFTNIKITFP